MEIKGKYLKVAGKRMKISISAGPWVEGVNPELIKIRPWTSSRFPNEVRQALSIENNSDMMTDYFEADSIRLLPGHPLYCQAKAAA